MGDRGLDLDHECRVEEWVLTRVSGGVGHDTRPTDGVVRRVMHVTVHPEGRLMSLDQR